MCRRVGERVCTSDKCPAVKRQQPPGVHGTKGYRRLTEFGTQMREKQKTKYLYGVMEKQFSGYYEKAASKSGNTAEFFLQLLERRLDNVIFRMGFARTRAQARQLVGHGFVLINGKRVTIPSYQVRAGEVITLKPSVKGSALWKSISAGRQGTTATSWLSVDEKALEGKVTGFPAHDDFPPNINMTLVVEFYSR